MSKVKLFSVVAVVVLLFVSLAATSPSRADDPGPAVTVEKREISEGTITEITEVIDSPAAEPEVASSLVYTNVIEVPEGTIIEQVEVINPSADFSASGSEPTGSADFLPIEVEVDADGVPLFVSLVATSPSRADDPGPAVTVEKREISEGTITEITEVIDSPAAEPEVASSLVYTNVIEVPEGIIIEQVEVINPSADFSASGSEPTGSADFLPIEVEVDADGVPFLSIR